MTDDTVLLAEIRALRDEVRENRQLLNNIVEVLDPLPTQLALIESTQKAHGTAIESLRLDFEEHLRSNGSGKLTPLPEIVP